MILKLFLIFSLVPLTELYILMKLGSIFGVFTTLFIVIGTGVLGAVIARGEGYKALFQLQNDMQNGRMPARGILDLILIFFAGVVLIVPGVLTDILGLIMLMPSIRAKIADYIFDKIRDSVAYRDSIDASDSLYDDSNDDSFDV